MCSLCVDFAQAILDGEHRQPQRGDRVDHHVVADVGELRHGQQLRLAELGHVGQQRGVHRGAELLEVGRPRQRLGEDQVGAGVGVSAGPLDRGAHALNPGGVGAGADDEVGVAPRGHRRPQAFDHLGGRDDGFAVEVAAAFGVDLVFDVHP
ncbi:MAG: hypothetical protein QOI30_1227, partial [Mycobacterium sp.]|nr:hypothetical protein [Mycobacterium sp.]